MISIGENYFRDYLFEHHKENFSKLIVGKREPVKWTEDSFPSIQFLLQRRIEQKINEILDNLEELVLTAKELRLERNALHPTRVDLFGNSESGIMQSSLFGFSNYIFYGFLSHAMRPFIIALFENAAPVG